MRALCTGLALLAVGAAAQPCPTAEDLEAPAVVRDGDVCVAVVAFEAAAGDAAWAAWYSPEPRIIGSGRKAVATAPRVLGAEIRSADGAFRISLGRSDGSQTPFRVPAAGLFELRIRTTPDATGIQPSVRLVPRDTSGNRLVPVLPRADDLGPLAATVYVHVEAGHVQPFYLWGLDHLDSVAVTATGPLGDAVVHRAVHPDERYIDAAVSGRYRVRVSFGRAAAVETPLEAALDLYRPRPAADYRAWQARDAARGAGGVEDIWPDPADVPPPAPPPPGQRRDGG